MSSDTSYSTIIDLVTRECNKLLQEAHQPTDRYQDRHFKAGMEWAVHRIRRVLKNPEQMLEIERLKNLSSQPTVTEEKT